MRRRPKTRRMTPARRRELEKYRCAPEVIPISNFVYAVTEDIRTPEQLDPRRDNLRDPVWSDKAFRTSILLEEPYSEKTLILNNATLSPVLHWLVDREKYDIAEDILDAFTEGMNPEPTDYDIIN